MRDVKVGGGFIQQDDGRLLSECTGNECTLAFTTGEIRDGMVRKMADVRQFHHTAGNFPVLDTFKQMTACVRGPAHEHDFLYRKRKLCLPFLGYEGDSASKIRARIGGKGFPLEVNSAFNGEKDAIKKLQQRRLA